LMSFSEWFLFASVTIANWMTLKNERNICLQLSFCNQPKTSRILVSQW
jgi:hypothetical protein